MVCLIIASSQVEITGHPTFSFEMLFEKFRDQVRASTSAPVQLNGGHVGMVKCTREVLLAVSLTSYMMKSQN
jgi:origin recognition complex subunit 4